MNKDKNITRTTEDTIAAYVHKLQKICEEREELNIGKEPYCKDKHSYSKTLRHCPNCTQQLFYVDSKMYKDYVSGKYSFCPKCGQKINVPKI